MLHALRIIGTFASRRVLRINLKKAKEKQPEIEIAPHLRTELRPNTGKFLENICFAFYVKLITEIHLHIVKLLWRLKVCCIWNLTRIGRETFQVHQFDFNNWVRGARFWVSYLLNSGVHVGVLPVPHVREPLHLSVV